MKSINYLNASIASALVAINVFSSLSYGQNFDHQAIKSATEGILTPQIEPLNPNKILNQRISLPKIGHFSKAPENAKDIKFHLKGIKFTGATALSLDQLQETYSSYLNKEISVAKLYEIVDLITLKYRNSGYFLATAFVPNQDIVDGNLNIKIIEGHIGEIEFDFPTEEEKIFQEYINMMKTKSPVTSKELESFILRLNEIPGMEFRSVISTLNEEEGAVKLTLVKNKEKEHAYLSLTNYESRYLGNQDINFSIKKSFKPMQVTSASISSSLPVNRMKNVNLEHSVLVMPDVNIYASASFLKANPDLDLDDVDIDVKSSSLKLGVRYQYIKQRDSALDFKLILEGKRSNVYADSASSNLTNDNVRALRFISTYYLKDSFSGNNAFKLTLSKGLNAFGASKAGSSLLSRADAVPDFKKAEFSYSRLQEITGNWSMLAFVTGQYSNDPLFASEEFGYGGQFLGRAYDTSEVAGDKGIAASLELKYQMPHFNTDSTSTELYGFYDIGKTWNNDTGLTDNTELGASFGFGSRSIIKDFVVNFGLAWPLNTRITNSTINQADRNTRLFLQITYKF